jgi:hypothetical protein
MGYVDLSARLANSLLEMDEKVLPIVRPSHSEFIRFLLAALWGNIAHLKCKWQLVRDLVLSHEDND